MAISVLHISYKDHITNEIVCKKYKRPSVTMVRTCDQIKWPLQKDRRRHNTREKKKKKAKEKMGRQHQRVDQSRLQQQSESSGRPSEESEDCRQKIVADVNSCAPTTLMVLVSLFEFTHKSSL